MFEDTEDQQTSSYWPSVSDLFMTLFIISVAMLVNFDLMQATSKDEYDSLVELVGGLNLEKIRIPVNSMRKFTGADLLTPNQNGKEVVQGLSDTAREVVVKLAEFNTKDKESGGLMGQIARLQNDLNTARENLATAQAERDRARKELEKALADLKAANLKIAELDKQNKAYGEGVTEIPGYQQTIKELTDQNKDLREQIKKLNHQPPFFDVPSDVAFGSGDASIASIYQGTLTKEFQKLANFVIENGDSKMVDTFEIVGHTDGQSIGHPEKATMTSSLPDYLGGGANIGILHAASNSELGLLRALVMKEEWTKFINSYPNEDHKKLLKTIGVRTYSAAQTAPPVDLLPGTVFNSDFFRKVVDPARRIELRLTKLKRDPVAPATRPNTPRATVPATPLPAPTTPPLPTGPPVSRIKPVAGA